MTKLHHLFASIVICNIIRSGLSSSADAPKWNYDDSSNYGPSNWSVSYPMCGGVNQSPININLVTTVAMPNGTIITLSDGYKMVPTNLDAYTLINSGHGAQVNIVKNTASGMRMYHGGLEGTYILEQFHFHWGETAQVGSEHLVNSSTFGLEIHFVHFAERFANVAEAVASNDTDALAVLGVFVNVANNDSSPVSKSLEALANSLETIPEKGNETRIDPFALSDLLPAECNQQYYRYSGSLTTPACNEVVVWTVLKNAIYISDESMDKFRSSIYVDGVLMTHNYRPPQSIGDRTVYHFYDLPAGCNAIQTTAAPPEMTTIQITAAPPEMTTIQITAAPPEVTSNSDANGANLHVYHNVVLLVSAVITASSLYI